MTGKLMGTFTVKVYDNGTTVDVDFDADSGELSLVRDAAIQALRQEDTLDCMLHRQERQSDPDDAYGPPQKAQLVATVLREVERHGVRVAPEQVVVRKPDGKMGAIKAEVQCSTDIPADALGEVCAEALQQAWKSGMDPVNDRLMVMVAFGVAK